MSPVELENRLLAAAAAAEAKSAEELIATVGEPPERVRPTIVLLTEAGKLHVQEGGLLRAFSPSPAVSQISEFADLEWRVINFLRSKNGRRAQEGDVIHLLGELDAADTIGRLVTAGILVRKGHWLQITPDSASKIPLTPEERAELQEAEARIRQLDGEIYGKELEIARHLRNIRDKKLYRETHAKFDAYIAETFNRTRDWAYKRIAELDVIEGLIGDDETGRGEPNQAVEALIPSVTAREVVQLAKLKKDPDTMRSALMQAEQLARVANRPRTSEDVRKAVEAANLPQREPEVAAELGDGPEPEVPKVMYSVKFSGIDQESVETDDLPKVFMDVARRFKAVPVTKKFSVTVTPVPS